MNARIENMKVKYILVHFQFFLGSLVGKALGL